jgi:drug/metabolite transporter (DMT)-like permease
MYLVFITYALFASVFTVGKLALTQAPPFFLTGTRYLIAGIILCLYELYRGRLRNYSLFAHLPLLLCIGFFNVFLTNGLEFWGLQYLSSGKTSLFYSLSPFFSVILAYLILGERMTKRKWIGLLIGLVGFVTLIFNKENIELSQELWSLGAYSLSEMAVSISALTSVIGWIYFKKLTVKTAYPINLANGYSFLIAGTLGLLISFFFESFPKIDSSENIISLSWQIAYITIVHSIICYTLYAMALKRFSITFMAFAGISNPVFTALYGSLFLDERVDYTFVICIFLFSIGLYLFYLDEKKSSFIKKDSIRN